MLLTANKSHLEGERTCAECSNTYFKKYGMSNSRCSACISKDKYHRNKEAKQKYHREWARRERLENYPRVRERELAQSRRRDLLKERYGITEDQYRAKYEAQGSKCAICPRTRNTINNCKRELFVDHDHETGALRDLLCNHCNSGLGQFFDNPELLEKAAAYLRKHGK